MLYQRIRPITKFMFLFWPIISLAIGSQLEYRTNIDHSVFLGALVFPPASILLLFIGAVRDSEFIIAITFLYFYSAKFLINRRYTKGQENFIEAINKILFIVDIGLLLYAVKFIAENLKYYNKPL